MGANILYADRGHPVAAPHLDGTIANYVIGLMYYSVLTGKSPIGLSGKAYKLGNQEDEELRIALQTAVWEDELIAKVRQRVVGVEREATLLGDHRWVPPKVVGSIGLLTTWYARLDAREVASADSKGTPEFGPRLRHRVRFMNHLPGHKDQAHNPSPIPTS